MKKSIAIDKQLHISLGDLPLVLPDPSISVENIGEIEQQLGELRHSL